MFYLPFSFIIFILFIFLLPFLFFLIQFGIIGAVSTKLGFPISVGILIYFLSLLGSTINIPLSKKPVETGDEYDEFLGRFFGFPKRMKYQVIAVNVGGCIIPVLLSLYFFQFVPLLRVIIGIGIMAIITYFLARPVKGIGIAIPALIPPILCVILTLILAPGNPAFAYVCGVLGVLIGADVLHLKDLRGVNRAGVMSIGGAGVFDGIFLVGIISVLLA